MQATQKSKAIVVSPEHRELIEFVKKAACQYYGVSEQQLVAEHALATARHNCFYIISRTAGNVRDYAIGHFFNRRRTAVRYGIDLIEVHKDIYGHSLDSLNSIITIANTFDKKYSWQIIPVSSTRH